VLVEPTSETFKFKTVTILKGDLVELELGDVGVPGIEIGSAITHRPLI